MRFSEVLETLLLREHLDQTEAFEAFGQVLSGEWDVAQVAALLIALRAKGESPAEIAGAAEAMRYAAVGFDTGDMQVADSCGTGGDGLLTINVSTAAGLVAAAAGVLVVKHGNRSVSSACGSADVLEACGASVDIDAAVSREALAATGFCLLFAPRYHPGLRRITPVRRALGTRTLFNILGPLANPARPAFQVVGTSDPRTLAPMAETLRRLGCKRALIVHGGGLDEIALHAATQCVLLDGVTTTALTLTPEDVGLRRAPVFALSGGNPVHNANILRATLAGQGAREHRDVIAMNAGALLWVAGGARSFHEGVNAAGAILDRGAALTVLERYVEVCRVGIA